MSIGDRLDPGYGARPRMSVRMKGARMYVQRLPTTTTTAVTQRQRGLRTTVDISQGAPIL